jgi:hypothetical protein
MAIFFGRSGDEYRREFPVNMRDGRGPALVS